MTASPFNRRKFLQSSVATAALISSAQANDTKIVQHPVFQATGIRVGEVTPTSAIVWTRLTKNATRTNDGIVFKKRGKSEEALKTPVEQIEGACPGQPGKIRLHYTNDPNQNALQMTDWIEVDESTDFIHQFELTDLQPATEYHVICQTQVDGEVHDGARLANFRTAPKPDEPKPVNFCVMTCQGYPDRDHEDGHPIYPAMTAKDPDFISLTGDLIYYDNDAPSAMSVDLARLHWQRMFSLPRLVDALSKTSTYWLKDDHDTLDDDSWPGQKYGTLTFEKGQDIFRQQAPLGSESYRTFRWGKDLQIWLTDGRDFRTPNKMPDGPEKTIWGTEQKAWFKRTVRESDATWKILISPTPIVGPDRKRKNDNHANEGFAHEGNEIRRWMQEHVPDNFFVVCGDRHWQYHSVHPETGVKEFSVGAASNSHAGGTPGRDPNMHRFHKVQGGFLNVSVNSSSITFQLCDVDGNVSFEQQFTTS
ncbi:alkaline phosphatase D family protein [Bremerella sp. T1]|uniref:alkaline phosphatase D family protein n=1 Tax=Bremerella sp. TYQ1 TaxID=3119568 RepID=UPI001CCB4802|nr:alkaline phosphatase D family protein [Bremerella volcania]UBM35770.1 alkaline phosphatase D family protein [Bremerella volcania]